MVLNFFQKIPIFCSKNKFLQNYMSVRYARMKHRPTKFLIMNTYQPWPSPIDIKKIYGEINSPDPSEMRDMCRRYGVLPSRVYFDKLINFNCSMAVFDEFIPPEGDGKSSFLSVADKARETSKTISANVKNIKNTRTIRKYEPDFSRKKIIETGDSIYQEVLNIVPNYKNNESRLLELVTEKALGEMVKGLEYKTLVHSFHQHLEEPRLISVRTQDGTSEGQVFAQVILRFFSEQTIAIYDVFGRLVYGSNEVAQDMLEYVVFEKQISEEFSQWRIHAKLIPNWVTNKLVYHRTFRNERDKCAEA